VIEFGLREVGAEIEVDILGAFFKATVIEESPRDPQNGKLRA
jgi:glycine cleavage system aminomethyltransferase T